MANDNKPSRDMKDYTAEEIAEVVMNFRAPPPGGWDYQKKDKQSKAVKPKDTAG